MRLQDPAGKMRRRMAAEELADIDRIDARLKAMKAELKEAVLATRSHLIDIRRIGPAASQPSDVLEDSPPSTPLAGR